jgi:hypothetical protein
VRREEKKRKGKKREGKGREGKSRRKYQSVIFSINYVPLLSSFGKQYSCTSIY